MVQQDTIHIKTSGHRDMHDITEQVAKIVAGSGIRTGTAHVFNVGSTACVGMIEYEAGLEADLPAILEQADPAQPALRPRAGRGTTATGTRTFRRRSWGRR